MLRGAIDCFLLVRTCAAWTLLAEVEVPSVANASRNHVRRGRARHVHRRPTQRAADGGWAARFSAFFVALSFLHFDGESHPTPTALTQAVGRARAKFWKIERVRKISNIMLRVCQ